ncbi:MAG TPA: hypothetical protein ENJ79_07110 [Gammaproteobacteria bacterium]|nr:hypothetical protein [Gammaproteobacteria bacterium]
MAYILDMASGRFCPGEEGASSRKKAAARATSADLRTYAALELNPVSAAPVGPTADTLAADGVTVQMLDTLICRIDD